MRTKSFIWYSLLIGGVHFLASLAIVPLTLRVGEHLARHGGAAMLLKALHLLTRALYFPIMGLALYPRFWFPGSWIAVPILVNSLLWGVVVAGGVTAWQRYTTAR